MISKQLTNFLFWVSLVAALSISCVVSVAEDSIKVNSLEKFDEFDEFYFQKNLAPVADEVILDRSQTFDVNMLGLPGAACMKKINLSSSGTLSSEVFGKNGEVKVVLSKQGYCSQPNDAYAFSDHFRDKQSAFSSIKSLESFPLLGLDRSKSSADQITVFSLLNELKTVPTITRAFCGSASEEFGNYVSNGDEYSFVMLAIFEKNSRWPDECAASEGVSEGQILTLRMAVVQGEYFEISGGTVVGVDPIAGTIFKHKLSNSKFCFFGKDYSFAMLSRQAFQDLAQQSERKLPNEIKKKLGKHKRQQVNRLVAHTVERELRNFCEKVQ